jgi:hypothetical protein
VENGKNFLNGIVYANYIVPSVGKSARIRPSQPQWDSAWPPFKEFLMEMSPGLVLIFGFGVWGNILKNAGDELSGRKTDSEAFIIGGSVKAKICVIRHPASWARHKYTPEMANKHFQKKFGPDWPRKQC